MSTGIVIIEMKKKLFIAHGLDGAKDPCRSSQAANWVRILVNG